MRVSAIEVCGVGRPEMDVRIDLPETGVVLIVGANGAGKSCAVQALPLTLWGRPVGRTPIWRDGVAAQVAVVIDGIRYRRSRSAKGKLALTWAGGPDFERATDAQAALEQTLGDADAWGAAYLLDQQGAFASDADAGRKRILEAAVGLARLDAAYKLATARERTAAQEAQQAVAAHGTAHARKVDAQASVVRLATLKDTVAPPAPAGDLQAMTDAMQVARSEALEAQKVWADADRAIRGARDRVAAARRTADQVAAGTCPTCGQATGAEHAGRAAQVAIHALAQQMEVEALHGDPAKLERQFRELEAEHRALADAVTHAQQATQLRRQVAGAVAAWREAVEQERALDAASKEASAAVARACDAHTAAKVAAAALAPKGARAQLLQATCAWLTAAASRWTAVGFPGVEVVVSASRPASKAGETVDAITVGVRLPGGETDSPSRGELRRVDLALTLALAELQEAATGRPPGTIFLDEALDILDPEGIEGCAQILREAARTRCVVLVAHQAAAVISNVADQVIEIVGGQARRVR